MQTYNKMGLRESLEQLETAKLDEMLQAELEKSTPDPDSIRLIMRILEGRESAAPEPITSSEEAAWQQYQKRMAGLRKKPSPVRRWVTAVASVVLVVGLLFAVVPQQAEAETFWEMLQRWSNTVLGYFNRDDKFGEMNYIFETDNPGLQQVYDAVVEMGVTDPVVPMWLPEGYELIKLESKNTPMLQGLWACFSMDENQLIYKLDVFAGEPAHEFYRDNSYYEEYEKNGINFCITQNNGSWVAVWTKDNIECFLTLDCQEETFRRVLRSIFVMEGT